MAGQSLLTHPGFDSRMRTWPSPLGVPVNVQRGFMVWDIAGGGLGYKGGKLGGRDKINFLFNPSTVNASFSVANASLQAAMLYPVPGSTSTLLAPLQQTVTWDLYFDRLFELNGGTTAGTGKGAPNDPAVIGCQADVIQFMQFTGMLANLQTANGKDASGQSVNIVTGAALGGSGGVPASALGNGGIMVMMPCWVFFGSAINQAFSNGSTNWAALNKQLSYYGYISSWSVNYTHFTQNMVPVRCVISVSFTMLPAPTTSSTLSALNSAGVVVTGPGSAVQVTPTSGPGGGGRTVGGPSALGSGNGVAGR